MIAATLPAYWRSIPVPKKPKEYDPSSTRRSRLLTRPRIASGTASAVHVATAISKSGPAKYTPAVMTVSRTTLLASTQQETRIQVKPVVIHRSERAWSRWCRRLATAAPRMPPSALTAKIPPIAADDA